MAVMQEDLNMKWKSRLSRRVVSVPGLVWNFVRGRSNVHAKVVEIRVLQALIRQRNPDLARWT